MSQVIQSEVTEKFAVYHADCCEAIKSVPDESVGYSIFSPPFSSLYTYSASDRDLGNCANDAQFFEHFAFLVPELYRVTMPGRCLSFHCANLSSTKSMHGYIGRRDFRGDLIRAFQKAGWIFHSEVTIWKDPVVEMQRTKALGLLWKQLKKDSSRSRQGHADYLVTMVKPGDNPVPVAHTAEEFPVAAWQQYASPVWLDVNQGRTLQRKSAREEADEKHVCPLQLDVIERAVDLWSAPGDVLLSPFAGIGSEGYVAVQKGRRFIGMELKESYYKQAVANLHVAAGEKVQTQLGLFGPIGTEE